ncbi:MAG: hypothetical protein O9353_12105 [Bacteroidia bacterium]|nr:hypothetical protein [Bacteroidia bacterium]
MIVQQDDGVSKDEENGYIISPLGSSNRLITFYKNMDQMEPFFYVDRDSHQSASLRFTSGTSAADEKQSENASTFLHQDGSVGFGKRCESDLRAEFKGFAGMEGRKGTYRHGDVPADGKWHKVAEDLDNCQAFEVMARTGKKGSGKFSIMHAIALSAFGKSSSSIRKTRAYYGFFWNKLNLRWSGTTHNYCLELRANRNYGKGVNIYYNIAKLWDDELFLKGEEYYPAQK